MSQPETRSGVPWAVALPWLLFLTLVSVNAVWLLSAPRTPDRSAPEPEPPAAVPARLPRPRMLIDESGWTEAINQVQPWSDPTSLTMMRDAWDRVGYRGITILNHKLVHEELAFATRFQLLMGKAVFYLYEGEPKNAYAEMERARGLVERDAELRTNGCRR